MLGRRGRCQAKPGRDYSALRTSKNAEHCLASPELAQGRFRQFSAVHNCWMRCCPQVVAHEAVADILRDRRGQGAS
eukprot:8746022-Alexandrium_andersonii.AAC.1